MPSRSTSASSAAPPATPRQHHHGARGADPGGAGDRHGGAQLRRRGDRPGRAPGRSRQPAPAPGQDPRHPGRLRGGRRKTRAPRPDLRHRLQPGLHRRDARADGLDPADADERAQADRPPRRAGAVAEQRGQPRHRHARRRRRGRQRGTRDRPDHADHRARLDRRRAGGRPGFRRGGRTPRR